jgi:hypothetical protein
MEWQQLLASITGSVDEELRLRNAYVTAENRILRNQIQTRRVLLTDTEHQMLAAMDHTLGRQALAEIATLAKPDTILTWHRKFIDHQSVRAQPRQSVGRPRMDQEIEVLAVRMARENRTWGYDRIQGALTHLGYTISDQTVGNILKRHGIPPALERKKTVTWQEFIRIHMDVLLATDSFHSEIWSGLRLVIACLFCCMPCGRQQVTAVRMLLHLLMQGVRFFVLHARNVHAQGQRWDNGITPCPQSWAMRRSADLQDLTISRVTPEAERQVRLQDTGRVVFLSAARSKQIRDGPIQRRQRRNILWQDELRRAA